MRKGLSSYPKGTKQLTSLRYQPIELKASKSGQERSEKILISYIAKSISDYCPSKVNPKMRMTTTKCKCMLTIWEPTSTNTHTASTTT